MTTKPGRCEFTKSLSPEAAAARKAYARYINVDLFTLDDWEIGAWESVARAVKAAQGTPNNKRPSWLMTKISLWKYRRLRREIEETLRRAERIKRDVEERG